LLKPAATAAADLGTFLVAFRSDAKQTPQKKVRDFEFNENVWQSTNCPEHLTNHAVSST